MRIFLLILMFGLSAGAADVPTAQQISDQSERGLAHIGRGRNATLLSLGMPAPVTNGNAADYAAAVKRYRELAEQARRQQSEALEARRAADLVRTELRTGQVENQRSLADAQRRLEDLSRSQTTNLEEVRSARTALENEIAERTRANSDYDQQLTRFEQNDSDLGKKIEQMNEPISAAESGRAHAARSLADRGLTEDGTQLTNGGGASPTGGNVVVASTGTTSGDGSTTNGASGPGQILVPGAQSDPHQLTGASAMDSSFGGIGGAAATESRAQMNSHAPGNFNSNQNGLRKESDQGSGIPDMNAITQAIKEAQAAELKKAANAAAAAASIAARQQVQVSSACRANPSSPTCTKPNRAADAASGTQVGVVARAGARVLQSAPGSTTPTVALQGQPVAQPRDYSSPLSRDQANRITLRMAARVRDLSEPRKAFDPIEIPTLPSQSLSQPGSTESNGRLPASTR